MCPHPSPSLWVSVWRGRGLCHPTQTGRASFCPFSDLLYLGVFGEPSAAVSGIQPLHPLPWPRSAPGREGGRRVGAPSGIRLTKCGGGSRALPLGAPLHVCARWGNTVTPLEASLYWTPMWAASTPRWSSPLVPPAPLPARAPPRSGAPSPGPPPSLPARRPRPWARPQAELAGPWPLPSPRCAPRSRQTEGQAAAGPAGGARARSPSQDPRGECARNPFCPEAQCALGFVPPPCPPPGSREGGPPRSPPPPLRSGQSSHPPGTAPTRFCLAPPPGPPFRPVAGT